MSRQAVRAAADISMSKYSLIEFFDTLVEEQIPLRVDAVEEEAFIDLELMFLFAFAQCAAASLQFP